MPLLRHLIVILPLAAVGLWTMWPLVPIVDKPIPGGIWILVVISALANLYILFYHYTTPPHPKFLMLRYRRIWLRIHIISGSLEFIAGIILLLLPGQTWPGLLMASFALFFHVPSSFAQNRIVAGSRAIMIPTYIAGITVHGFCALMLLLRPNSVFWAVNTFILFNTYAWVRIYGFAAMKFNLFGPARYTVMVLGAGATTMTPVLGPLWPMQLALFLLIYIGLYKYFFAESPADFENFVREHSRWSGVNAEVVDFWGNHEQDKQSEQAKEVFDFFDQEKRGVLSATQLQSLLASWALPPEAIRAFLEKIGAKESITFETFLQKLWSVSTIRNRASLAVKVYTLSSLRDKAQFVFDMLDLDKDGTLKLFELKLLFLEWNLPPDETETYFALCDSDRKGVINFDQFYHRMKPVWQYLFYHVFSLQVKAENLLSDVPLSGLEQDKRHAQELYARTKQELINKVYFLRDAPPLFLQDLAESFQPETFAKGHVIIREWSQGDRFYVLVKGEVQITRQGSLLSTLQHGASFGESALLFKTRRNASVIAISDVLVYSLSRTSFLSLVQQYPMMQKLLEQMIAQENKKRIEGAISSLLQTQNNILAVEASEIVSLLAKHVTEVVYAKSENIVVEGEPGDSFFLIQSGSVMVHRGTQELVRYVPGDCFGEAALLSGNPRNATVTALEDSVLFRLQKDDFYKVLDTYPSLKAHILQLHELRTSLLM